MRGKTLLEGDVGAPREWCANIGLERHELDELIRLGVFAWQAKQDLLRVSFVGFIALRRELIVCVPKAVPSLGSRVLRRLLRVYFQRSALRRNVPDPLYLLTREYTDDSIFRELDAAVTLIENYCDRGPYLRTRSDRAQHGRVNWSATLASSSPAISLSGPIYLDEKRVRQSGVPNRVTEIQMALIDYLSDKYALEKPPALERDLAHYGADLQWPLLQPRQALRDLDQERGVTFDTEKLRLIAVLRACILDWQGMSGARSMRLFGTNAFYAVWEDACRVLFEPMEATIVEGIAQPTWHNYSDGGWTKILAGEQRPDILLTHQDETLIIDAKYYFPFPQNRPAWSDIVKQLYYRASLPADITLCRNAFLLPERGSGLLRFRGWVTIQDATGADRFQPLEVWSAGAEAVLSAYLADGSSNSWRHLIPSAVDIESAEVAGNA